MVAPPESWQPSSESPLLDPFHGKGPPPPPKRPLSPAAVASALLALLPVGSMAAIPVGVVGLRQTRSGGVRGRWLAIASIALGSIASLVYGSAAAYFAVGQAYEVKAREAEAEAWRQKKREREADAVAVAEPASKDPAPSPSAAPSSSSPPSESAPPDTRVTEVGQITVVDLGVSEPSLRTAFAREVAVAKAAGKDVLVMTTEDSCVPCKGVAASLADQRMQSVLGKIRLVRVNIDVFKDDLAKLGLQVVPYPVYALLTADGSPRDAIDGGEWEEDVAENIAPVLGAFVQGEFKKRKKPFKPGGGVFL